MNNLRVQSIDIFRALTMWLMIFVNDLWSLSDIPGWLEHKPADYDGMGLSDVVFPAFLFIVGLSIPLAVKAREKKGDSNLQIVQHIAVRTLALVAMGFFMVNLENINDELIPINKYVWQLLMTLAFFLIWNIYKNDKMIGGLNAWIPRGVGLLILAFLAYNYQSGTAADPQWLQPHWWGILGLIGWAYLLCAVLYVYVRDRLIWMSAICGALYFFNAQEFMDVFGTKVQFVVSASNHALVMSGVLVTVLVTQLKTSKNESLVLPGLIGVVVIFLAFGFITRPEWGISKIYATPSWTAICAGISVLTFALLYLIADKFGYSKWADFLGPAGRSTLTCYLIPYFVYGLLALAKWELPEVLTTGYVGLLKSMIFGLLIIQMTGLLDKWFKVRLRV